VNARRVIVALEGNFDLRFAGSGSEYIDFTACCVEAVGMNRKFCCYCEGIKTHCSGMRQFILIATDWKIHEILPGIVLYVSLYYLGKLIVVVLMLHNLTKLNRQIDKKFC